MPAYNRSVGYTCARDAIIVTRLQEKILPSRSAVNCLDLSSTRNGDCNTERVAEISEIDWRVASGSPRRGNIIFESFDPPRHSNRHVSFVILSIIRYDY